MKRTESITHLRSWELISVFGTKHAGRFRAEIVLFLLFLFTSHKRIQFVWETLPPVPLSSPIQTHNSRRYNSLGEHFRETQCPPHLGVQRSPVTPTSVGARQRRATYKPHASAIGRVVCSPPPPAHPILSLTAGRQDGDWRGKNTCRWLFLVTFPFSLPRPTCQPAVRPARSVEGKVLESNTLSINKVVRTHSSMKFKRDSPQIRNANHLKSKRNSTPLGRSRSRVQFPPYMLDLEEHQRPGCLMRKMHYMTPGLSQLALLLAGAIWTRVPVPQRAAGHGFQWLHRFFNQSPRQ